LISVICFQYRQYEHDINSWSVPTDRIRGEGLPLNIKVTGRSL